MLVLAWWLAFQAYPVVYEYRRDWETAVAWMLGRTAKD